MERCDADVAYWRRTNSLDSHFRIFNQNLANVDCKVRREEQRVVKVTEQRLREERVREALEREQFEREAVKDAAAALRAAFAEDDGAPAAATRASADICASARADTVTCYMEHGSSNPAKCKPQVDAFSACARAMQRHTS
jgi:hypothetical protein